MRRALLAFIGLCCGIGILYMLPSWIGGGSGPAEASIPTGALASAIVGRPASEEGPAVTTFGRVHLPDLEFEETSFPFLSDEPNDVSVSLGTVTTGSLINSAEVTLPGDHYRILPPHLLRNLRYTSDQLLEIVTVASVEVAREFPGSVLWLGNFGRRGGGDISYSVSHNSGRDCDLAFYYSDAAGDHLSPPELLTVDRQGAAPYDGVAYYFDVPRNWALVRSLISHREIQVQFLFIANHLKERLLLHAEQMGEPNDLVRMAEAVLQQPGRSNPHDDHLHVRIYCSQGDVTRGCTNIGRIRPWTNTFESERRDRIREIRGFLSDPDDEMRARAIERLVILDAAERRAIAERLGDSSARVREVAARALGAVGSRAQVAELTALLEDEAEPAVLEAAVASLAALGGADAESALLTLLEVESMVVLHGSEVDVRAFAVDALGRLGAVSAIEPIAECLRSSDAYLRARALWALERLSNVSLGQQLCDVRVDSDIRRLGYRQWSGWIEANEDLEREDWLIHGFRDFGIEIFDGQINASALAQAVGAAPGFISYNAQQLLMIVSDGEVPSLTWPIHDAARYWRRSVERNH
jgi:murein endopeptidase